MWREKTYDRTGLRSLLRDRRGNVAMLFGLAVVPLFGFVGAAVDYGNGVRDRARLANALDAAVLSAASAHVTDSAAQAAVEKYVRANLGAVRADQALTVTASVDSAQAVTATATLSSPTWIMGMFGKPTMNVSATVKAAPGAADKMEIALVLDTTGSMSGAKLDGMKQAAKNLVTTIYAGANATSSVRVGIAPFADYVNVGLGYRNASWVANTQDVSTTSTTCADTYPDAKYLDPVNNPATCYNDGSPYDCSWTSYNTIILGTPVNVCSTTTSTSTWNGCVGSRNYPLDLQDAVDSVNRVPGMLDTWCAAPLQRLTNSVPTLTAQIDALTASSETYIAPGLLWGWRILSPRAPFADGAPYSAARKVLILMTDGANTRSPNYPDHWGGDVATANSLTSQTCAQIKANGIRVYTIAFGVTDTGIKSILQNCASTGGDYYDSATISDMQAAFASIGAKVGAIRLVR